MQKIISRVALSALLLLTVNLPNLILATPVQSAGGRKVLRTEDLSYKFYDQRISLIQKSNQVAVVFKSTGNTKAFSESSLAKLQKVLQGNARELNGPSNLNINVKPLGSQYAILTLPTTRSIDFQQNLKKRLEQSFIQTTLPVFQPQNAPQDSEQTIVLNNEMILSFEPGTAKPQVESILQRYNLEMVRPLRFTTDRYLVRSREASGTAMFPLMNQLSGISKLQSVSPNFVQSVSYQPNLKGMMNPLDRQTAVDPKAAIGNLPKDKNRPFPDSLLPYQWHLNSRSRQTTLGPRTDIRATEAWNKGTKGKDVLVAVIDSAIQWDHPDLRDNLYDVPQDLPDLLPGEQHGWDFSGYNSTVTCWNDKPTSCEAGDPDTRMSAAEISSIKPVFQQMFQSNESILKAYANLVPRIRNQYPSWNDSKIADAIRNWVLANISGEFHGTWVAGVMAATPKEAGGVVGVAPNAKILPVRVFGLGGEITTEGLLEAIGYAAARNVDVINMSLGALLPTQAEADQIFAVLDKNPKLVIIASSGNENQDGSGYPAGVPGVVSVGASNLSGERTPYSNFGRRLDVMAPGGDLSGSSSGGILTTGGTGIAELWEGLAVPKLSWGYSFDPFGRYVQVQGTSFSSPVVAGVVALMKSADPQRKLNRDQLVKILQSTSSYQPLKITQKDKNRYRLQKDNPSTAIPYTPALTQLPGILKPTEVLPIEQYYFGRGLVNAEAAVDAVNQELKK